MECWLWRRSPRSAGLFSFREADQGDLPRAAGLAEGRTESHPIGRDGVPLRAFRAAAAADRAVARATGCAAGGERGQGGARAADADPDFRGVARPRLRGRLRRRSPLCDGWREERASGDGGRLRAADLRAGRSLPVRLEPRDRRDERRDGDREGGARPALPQPDDVRAGLSARDPGDGVRRARTGLRLLQGRLHARHLRQHEDGGGDDLRRQGPPVQSPLPADVLAPSGRSGRLHAGLGLGEGPGREPGRPGRASGSSRRGCGSRATTS